MVFWSYRTGVDTFVRRFYISTARSNAPVRFLGQNYYGNGRTFIKAAPVAEAIGKFSFGLGMAMDGIGVWNYAQNRTSSNAVHPAKAGLNTTIGAIGVWGGPPGAVISISYFGIDAFYPGGWDGAMNDTARRQAEFDTIFKDSGLPHQYILPYGSQKF